MCKVASRAITTMPIWGLSALAAGSIGAPLAGTGKTDTPAHIVALDLPATYMQPELHPGLAKPRQSNLAASRTGRAVKDVGAKSQTGQSLIAFGATDSAQVKNTSGLNYMFTSQPVVAAIRDASPVAIAAQVGPRDKPGDTLRAAQSSLPLASPSRVGSQLQPGSNRAIYGTSANNAYKVYFPQIEPPATGNSIGQLETSGEAREQDNRILKKNGSYLFYESPSDTEDGEKIETSLNAGGGGVAEAVARAVAKLGKGAEEQKLTAPALQKKPLDFGQGLFKASGSAENAASTLEGGADASQ